MIYSKRKTLKAPVIRTAPTSTTTVIPAQAGIQKRNATGIYRKKQKPPTIIPAKAGIQNL
ncbi:hypothetical protein [Neisseria blantyrii]|uniref:hypothetical protein n=1 Tax=Neisseria blantyrii TaxID=2830647 RepID=UPI00272B8A13|nr:hypothetical protein [Neisseria blantyrii]